MATILPTQATESAPVAPVETPWRRFVTDFMASPLAVVGLVMLAAIIAIAIVAPMISPQNPYDLNQLDILDGNLKPGSKAGPGYTFWLGSDDQGRDMLSGIFYGLRISLGVGVMSSVLALALGLLFGLTAAYSGGRVEGFLMRVVDIQLSFPAILVALILIAVLGEGRWQVIVALVTVQWAYYARTVRGTALVERRKEYIEAALNFGLPTRHIMIAHLLPNSVGSVLVVASISIAGAITLEATLSFLGVGVPVTQPSLGLLIANGFEFLLSGEYWIAVFPGIALVLLIGSLNLVGDRLRRSFNVRS
jgi:peptide/nickel transport system permease protein